jgi:hypothetical protein
MWKRYTTDMIRFTFALLVILYTLPATLTAQDSVSFKRHYKWYIPDSFVLQYAGSIGFLSAGGGYDIFHKKASVDILFGYLPGTIGGHDLQTLTLKFTASPWKIRAGKATTIYPFSTGTYFTYTMGGRYSSDLPSWYPDGYYWWSEAVRANIFIGGKVRHKVRDSVWEGYYEIGTNELKLVSYAQNTGYLTVWDILHAGVGVRFYLNP